MKTGGFVIGMLAAMFVAYWATAPVAAFIFMAIDGPVPAAFLAIHTALAVPGYMFYLHVIDIGVEGPEF